jgi:lipid II:glycine glycyltransferase (peptidoglycan interpeptide bridge formation enzyme)
MIDIRQSLQYSNYLASLGWKVERINETNYFIRKFPLIGSVLKIQRPEKIDFGTIDKLCRKYRVFQVILEPNLASAAGALSLLDHNSLLHHGFKLSKSPYLPSKTLHIDLTQSQKEIFKRFKKDARYAVKRVYDPERAKRVERGRSITIYQYSSPKDIIRWRDAWKNSVKFDRYVPPAQQLINLRKSFGPNHSLFLASHNMSGSVIGGALFTISSHGLSNYISYYWYGFTNNEGRTSLSQYSLLYQGILWAKKMDCKVFDFEGIYDPRFPNKSWLGFSHFKKSFGGTEVLYPGCYTRFRLPW